MQLEILTLSTYLPTYVRAVSGSAMNMLAVIILNIVREMGENQLLVQTKGKIELKKIERPSKYEGMKVSGIEEVGMKWNYREIKLVPRYLLPINR